MVGEGTSTEDTIYAWEACYWIDDIPRPIAQPKKISPGVVHSFGPLDSTVSCNDVEYYFDSIRYTADSWAGTSGSGVLTVIEDEAFLVGIHHGGCGDTSTGPGTGGECCAGASMKAMYDASDYIRGIIDETDYDNDGIPFINDNCPDVYNPDQANHDPDDYGDVCDRDRDVVLMFSPQDVKELSTDGDEWVSTGRAKVSFYAVEAAHSAPARGSDIQVHWCDCQGEENSTGVENPDGSGDSSNSLTGKPLV